MIRVVTGGLGELAACLVSVMTRHETGTRGSRRVARAGATPGAAQALLAALLLFVAACSKKSDGGYGKLACLDGWPAAPANSSATTLAIAPAVLWQTPLVAGIWPNNPGVALVGDTVIASSGPGWASLDRKTGTFVSRGSTGPDPSNYYLGGPAADEGGTIYVQSAFALYAFAADGSKRWTVALPGAQ